MRLSEQKTMIFRVRNRLVETVLEPALMERQASAGVEAAAPPRARAGPEPFPPVETAEPKAGTPEFELWRAPVAPPLSEPVEEDPADVAPISGKPHTFLESCLKLALVGAVAALPASLYFDLRARDASASEELAALREMRGSLSRRQRALEDSRGEATALLEQQNLLDRERRAPRWTQSLQTIAKVAGNAVELLGVRARAQPDETGLSELRIDGACTAPDPATAAERFRKLLEHNLAEDFDPGQPKARVARLKAEPSAGSKAAFTMLVKSLGQPRATVAERSVP